jgi:hypothetical protein
MPASTIHCSVRYTVARLIRAEAGRIRFRQLFAAYQIEKIIRGQLPFLAQKNVDDEIALGGALAAGGPEAVEIGGRFHGPRTVHRLPLTFSKR